MRRSGKTDEAIAQYQKSLELDATFSPARVALATLASQVGKQALAMETLRAGSQSEQIPDTDRGYLAYLLSLVLVEEGQDAEALRSFELALKLNPENPRVASNYGLILVRQQQWAQAERVLGAGLQAHPSDYNVLNALVHLHLQKGELKQSLGFARKMLELYPDDSYSRNVVQRLEHATSR